MVPLGISRRDLALAGSALLGAGWLTRVAAALARDAELAPAIRQTSQPQSLILLWLAGGPSQLETFDPHPGAAIAAGTKAIDTNVPGVQLAEHYPRLAERMDKLCLVRSLVSKEGDHARALQLAKSGNPPNAVVAHPSLGAICCHQLPRGETDIPRHVSILSPDTAGRGGFLGPQYDAFQLGDPAQPVPDVRSRVSLPRLKHRLEDLEVVDRAFARERAPWRYGEAYRQTITQARAMMDSAQLAAFRVGDEPRAVRDAYGDTPFGRGCLAARRLIEVGVRCVEVTLPGWDSHQNNQDIHARLAETLDPAFSALLDDLAQRELLDRTLVVCLGEFGRTPKLNRVGGRDHWPHGFSAALAGGQLRTATVVGQTDPEGRRQVVDPCGFADLHATILTALNIDSAHEVMTSVGRPVKFNEGRPIAAILPG